MAWQPLQASCPQLNFGHSKEGVYLPSRTLHIYFSILSQAAENEALHSLLLEDRYVR